MPESRAIARRGGGGGVHEGTVSLASGAAPPMPYGLAARLGAAQGTDPEELASAALASCFSMSASLVLDAGGVAARVTEVEAALTFGRDAEGPKVTGCRLDVTAETHGAPAADVVQACEVAKRNCPVSRLFRAPITLAVRVTRRLDEDAGGTRLRVAAE